MAVRLHMKLGVVAEHDRLADSPDTLVVVEPSVGSVARSKGHLYLLVTSRLSSRHALEATRLAAETIRNEYYYDESAGIRVCLQKAIGTANKRLAHQARSPRDQGAGRQWADRDRRRGRPWQRDVRRDGRPRRGVPDPPGTPLDAARSAPRARPAVGCARAGRLARRDLGRGLAHPRLAERHRQARRGRAEGRDVDAPPAVGDGAPPPSVRGRRRIRSDGAIAFEATEVSSTSRARTLVPVRPAEPLAGAPDRSPIPLADNVQAASIAVSAAAGNARTAAGGAIERAFARVQDLMPQRKPAYRRVTPLSSRRETQRRAALAVLALVVVVGGLGLGVYAFGGNSPQEAISSVNAGQKALDLAKADLARVTGSGIDLVTDDPDQALRLLTDAHKQLDLAAAAKVNASVIAPLRAQTNAGLDRLYGVVPVASTRLFEFKPAEGAAPIDLGAMVRGPDGNPYVIDRSTKAVYRIGLKTKAATVVAKAGTKNKSGTVADTALSRRRRAGPADPGLEERPVALAAGGRHRQGHAHEGNARGRGLAGRRHHRDQHVPPARNAGAVQPVHRRPVRTADPGLFAGRRRERLPGQAHVWLATARDVSKMTSTYVDGDLFAADSGAMVRFVGGKNEGWDAKDPKDALLRPAPTYSAIAAGTARREGRDLRLRQAQCQGHRAGQGRRRLQGPVSARGRPQGLVGYPGDVRHPGRRGPARPRSSGSRATASTRRSCVAVPDTPRSRARRLRRTPSASPAKATAKPTKKP